MTMFGSTVRPGNPSRATLSAEERLLQVIQSGGAAPVQGPGRPWKGLHRRLWSTLKQLTHWKPRRAPRPARGFDLVRLNEALGAVIVVGVALAAVNAFFFKPDIGRMHGRVANALTPQGHPEINPVPVEEILAPLAGRSLFQPKTEENPPAAAPVPAAADLPGGALDNLQLVGIAWGAQAEAMIREKKEGRTFFLKQGEKFRGVLVKEILKDRVILEFAGQTKELM